jgi:hypothetical protein
MKKTYKVSGYRSDGTTFTQIVRAVDALQAKALVETFPSLFVTSSVLLEAGQ